MAKSNNQSTKKTTKKSKTKLFGLYGARISESGKYINLSVVSGEVDEDSGTDNREWATVLVKKKSKYVKVKVSSDTVTLTIPRLDVEDEEDEDEDEDEDDDEDDDCLDDSNLVECTDLPF